MATRAIQFEAMGEADRKAAAARAKAAKMDAENRRQLLRESCVECGAFGPWGDNGLFFCVEHVSDELRFPARHPQQRKVA